MKQLTHTLAVVLLFALGNSSLAQDEKATPTEKPTAIIDGEFAVRMLELEWRLTEIAVAESALEMEQIKVHLQAARDSEDEREAHLAEIELEKAMMNRESQEIHREIAKLRFEHEKENLKRLIDRHEKDADLQAAVNIEVVDELGVVVVRGQEADVKQVQKIVEGRATETNEASPEFEFKVYALEHAEADEIVSVLGDLFWEQVNGKLMISFDARTNSVIARGTESNLHVIEALIERLDQE